MASTETLSHERKSTVFFTWIFHHIQRTDRSSSSERRGRDPGCSQRFRDQRKKKLPCRIRNKFQFCHFPGCNRKSQGKDNRSGYRCWFRISLSYHLRTGSVQ